MGRRAGVRAGWLLLGCMVVCVGCRREALPRWESLMGGDLASLAVVADGGECLYGVDTGRLALRTVLRGEGMLIRKVARTPDGAVLFTDEAAPATPLLRRVDGHGRLAVSVPLHAYAVAPFAHAGVVAVGCRQVETDGAALVGLYDASSLSRRAYLRIRHGVRWAEDFYGYGDTVYVPHVDEPHLASAAYPILIDARSLDTTHCPIGNYLLDEQSEVFAMARLGDTLYMMTRTDQMLIKLHLPTRRVSMRRSIRYMLQDGYQLRGGAAYYLHAEAHALSMLYIWREGQGRRVEWVQIGLPQLRVVAVKRVMEDEGAWNDGEDLSVFGRFYLLVQRQGARRTLLLLDRATGEEAGRVQLEPGVR